MWIFIMIPLNSTLYTIVDTCHQYMSKITTYFYMIPWKIHENMLNTILYC